MCLSMTLFWWSVELIRMFIRKTKGTLHFIDGCSFHSVRQEAMDYHPNNQIMVYKFHILGSAWKKHISFFSNFFPNEATNFGLFDKRTSSLIVDLEKKTILISPWHLMSQQTTFTSFQIELTNEKTILNYKGKES